MTDLYIDPVGSKKKFLVPVVVLVLCAVSMTGAAFAYNSTVQNAGDIDGNYMVIEFTDKEGAVIDTSATLGAATGLVVTTATVHNVGPTVTATLDGSATVKVYFMIESDVDPAVTYNVTVDEASVADATVTGASSGHNTIEFDVATAFKLASNDSSVTAGTFAADTLYYVELTITSASEIQFANAAAKNDALAVQEAINNSDYILRLKAEDASA